MQGGSGGGGRGGGRGWRRVCVDVGRRLTAERVQFRDCTTGQE